MEINFWGVQTASSRVAEVGTARSPWDFRKWHEPLALRCQEQRKQAGYKIWTPKWKSQGQMFWIAGMVSYRATPHRNTLSGGGELFTAG